MFERSYDRHHSINLIKAGVATPIRETCEAALLMGANLLRHFGTEDAVIAETLSGVMQTVSPCNAPVISIPVGRRSSAMPGWRWKTSAEPDRNHPIRCSFTGSLRPSFRKCAMKGLATSSDRVAANSRLVTTSGPNGRVT